MYQSTNNILYMQTLSINVTHQYIEVHECNGNKLELLLCRGMGDGLDRDGRKNGDRDRVGIGEKWKGREEW